MKKNKKALLLISVFAAAALTGALLAFGACRHNGIITKNIYKHELLKLHGAYRNSCAVVEGECVKSYISAKGVETSEFVIISVLAGSERQGFSVGKRISVLGSAETGEKRILYLSSPVDDVHSENEKVYSVLPSGSFAIKNENIIIGERGVIPFDVLKNDIAAFEREITVHSKYYYYDNIKELVSNCDSVFIGRIDGITVSENISCFSYDRGEEIIHNGAVTELEITVLNGIAWRNSYGDKIELKITDNENSSIFYSKTHGHFAYENKLYELAPGDVCVFFVIDSPDEKEDHCFLINGCQGIILTDMDSIITNSKNAPFAEMKTLDELISALYRAAGIY